MHPKVITQRSKAAESRLIEALAVLAGRAGVEPVLPANSRDSDLRAVFTLEALADTAEAIVNASSAQLEQTEQSDKPKRGRPKA
jgi:hypothetical protein